MRVRSVVIFMALQRLGIVKPDYPCTDPVNHSEVRMDTRWMTNGTGTAKEVKNGGHVEKKSTDGVEKMAKTFPFTLG